VVAVLAGAKIGRLMPIFVYSSWRRRNRRVYHIGTSSRFCRSYFQPLGENKVKRHKEQ